MSADGGRPIGVLAALLDAMPDPRTALHTHRLEKRLADRFRIRHAVAVSSGTAALHTALVALGVGPGDDVLVPSVSVVMSIAPVIHTGARPVIVDCDRSGADFDYDDLARKAGPAARAVIPVYLWGRAGDPQRLTGFARRRGLRVVEDACQAHGTRFNGRLLGTFGDAGCFSMKDGKLLWSGEGGFVLTDDDELAARARAFRCHWLTPPDGEPPMSRPGLNYRLSEPQAVIACWNLARFDELLTLRRHQTGLLTSLLADAPFLRFHRPGATEEWNGYAPVARLALPQPRRFSARLAAAGVPNSVGTFGLVPADQRPLFTCYEPAECPNARTVLDTTLAVVLNERDDDDRIRGIAATITREAHTWTGD